jgi:hypothetical protein
MDGDMKPLVEIRLFAGADLLNIKTKGGSHAADIHAVHLFAACVLEEAGQNSAADRIGGHLDSLAAIGDNDAIVTLRSELRDEATEFVAEGEVWLHHGSGLRIDARHIDGIADFPSRSAARIACAISIPTFS